MMNKLEGMDFKDKSSGKFHMSKDLKNSMKKDTVGMDLGMDFKPPKCEAPKKKAAFKKKFVLRKVWNNKFADNSSTEFQELETEICDAYYESIEMLEDCK